MLREAVMVEGKNIAKQDVLFEIADRLVNKYPSILDLHQFASDLTNDNGLEAFRKDWHEAQNRGISRTPTLILQSQRKPAIMLTGYRPYSALLEAVKQVSPKIEPTIEHINVDGYRHFWGPLTDREIQEIL